MMITEPQAENIFGVNKNDMEENKITEHYYENYLEKMKLDESEMPEVQIQETRRAFFGGMSSMLIENKRLESYTKQIQDKTLSDIRLELEIFWLIETEKRIIKDAEK